MNNGKYLFAQITSLLPNRIFDRLVNQYEGDKWVKHFTCWNQLLVMMFGQLSNRDSLRDLITCLGAHRSKHYHLGFGKSIARSTIAEANEKRNYKIFEHFAYELIQEAQKITITNDDFNLPIKENVYAFDSSVIDLCLNVFWWATFRRAKGAIKLHTLLDLKTTIPVFVHISEASKHDVKVLDMLTFEPGGYYVMDRGYIDFERMNKIDNQNAFFVIRAKNNLRFTRISSQKADKENGVVCDQKINLKGFYSKQSYPKPLRRIKFYDASQERTFIFLTNNHHLKAVDIAKLYQYRWKI